MEVELIKNLKVKLPFCEVRSGKALTTIEMTNNGKPTGRDLVLRTVEEIPQLIEALIKVQEFFSKEETK